MPLTRVFCAGSPLSFSKGATMRVGTCSATVEALPEPRFWTKRIAPDRAVNITPRSIKILNIIRGRFQAETFKDDNDGVVDVSASGV
jgi:hypothetical protein